MTSARHSSDGNKDDGLVPLSFWKDKEVDLVTAADAQALNSIAAAQQYSTIGAFHDIHRNARRFLPNDFIVEYGSNVAVTHKYDANGATILHQCFQHGKYPMVKWLIENFPWFSLLPFLHKREVDGKEIILPYGGQNILHMAVLAKNHNMAKWILNYFSRASDEMLYLLLTERVYTQERSFFSKLGAQYFGETPLQFAVSMDDVAMFDIIMSFISLLEPIMLKKGKVARNMLFYPDCNGNNVVHLCARRGLLKMCEHIKYFAVEMLQQELMIAVHGSFVGGFHADKAAANVQFAKGIRGVKYSDFFDDDEKFQFTGHTRVLGDIALPDWGVLKDFCMAQVVGHLIKQAKDAKPYYSEEEIRLNTALLVKTLEKKNFFVNEDSIWKLLYAHLLGPSPSAYDILISELKRNLSFWLHGTEVGIKSGAVNRIFNCLFIYGLNKEYHSPVTLAAEAGQPLMLRYLLKQNISKGDRTYEFDLTGIEFRLEGVEKRNNVWLTCYEPVLPDGISLKSLIAWISQSADPKINLMIDSIPELSFVVNSKWERVGVVLFSESRILELMLLFLLVLWNALIGIRTYYHPAEVPVHEKFEIEVGTLLLSSDFLTEGLWNCVFWLLFINCNILLGYIIFRFHLRLMGKVCEVVYIFIMGWMVDKFWGAMPSKPKTKRVNVPISVPYITGLESIDKFLHRCSTTPAMLNQLSIDASISQNPAQYDIIFRFMTVFCLVACWTSIAWSAVTLKSFSNVPSTFVKYALVFSISDAFLQFALLNKELGCFILTLFHIFKKDYIYFFFFIGTVIVFALVVSDEQPQTFGTLMHGLMVQDESSGSGLPRFVYVMFHLTVNLVVINLLTTVMGNTYSWFNGDNINYAKAKLKCVRNLWMDVFIQFSDMPELHFERYAHKRPVFGVGEDSDSYIFRVMKRLEDVDKLHEDAAEMAPATIDSNEDIITHKIKSEEEMVLGTESICGGGKQIFHSNFWIDQFGNHPAPNTIISFSDVNNFVWKPVNRHQTDYCRYATSELEKKNMRLQISHYKRKVLVILHPQNDFSDRVPRMYPIESLVIEHRPGTLISESDKTSKPGSEFREQVLQFPLMINGCKAWFSGAEERKGTVKGVRVKGTATAAANRDGDGLAVFVEVLWEANRYEPRALCVEGFEVCSSDVRHFRRLQNALEQKLRVFLLDDPRPKDSRRYGRLTRVDAAEVCVRWNLSVPCCVPKVSLICNRIPEHRQIFDPGCTVHFKETLSEESSAQLNIPPRLNSKTKRPAGYIHGNGQVVKHTENLNSDFVEVFWEAENTCGNLPIQGSYADFTHTANLIRKNWAEYDEIIVSRDCHRCNHISHKSYWKKREDEVDPNIQDLELITYLDVLTGVIRPSQEAFTGHCLNYIWELENQEHYQHRIWPTHCLLGPELDMDAEKLAMERKYRPCADSHYRHIGHDSLDLHVYNSTRGHEIVPEIRDALLFWKSNWKKDKKVRKEIQVVDIGYNIAVEAYSIFKSEVENFSDPLSSLNQRLLANLNDGDTEIHVCGQALSHVVRFSFEDLMKHTTQPPSNITLLINCTSIVNGFYQNTAAFVNEMKAKGVQIQEVDRDGKLRRLDKSKTIEESIARHPVHRKEQKDSRPVDLDNFAPTSDVTILHASSASNLVSSSKSIGSICGTNADVSISLGRPGASCDLFRSLMDHLNRYAVANSFRDVVVKECVNYMDVDLKKMLGSRLTVLGIPQSLLAKFASYSSEDLIHLVDGHDSDIRDVIAGWICLLVCKMMGTVSDHKNKRKSLVGSPVRRMAIYDNDEDDIVIASITPRTTGGSHQHRCRGNSANQPQRVGHHQIRQRHDRHHYPCSRPRDHCNSNVHGICRTNSVDFSFSTSAVQEADQFPGQHLQHQDQQQRLQLQLSEEEDATLLSTEYIHSVELEEAMKRISSCGVSSPVPFLPSVSTILVAVVKDVHDSLCAEYCTSPTSAAEFESPTDRSRHFPDYQTPTELMQRICALYHGFTQESFQRMMFTPTGAVRRAKSLLLEYLHVDIYKDNGATWKYLSNLTLDRIVIELFTDTVQACLRRKGSGVTDIQHFVIDALGDCLEGRDSLVLDEDFVNMNESTCTYLRDLNNVDLITLLLSTGDARLARVIPEISLREMTGQMLIDEIRQVRDPQSHILDDNGVLAEFIEKWMNQKMYFKDEQ